MSKTSKKLDELLKIIENMPANEFNKLIGRHKIDDELIASYRNLEKLLIIQGEK